MLFGPNALLEPSLPLFSKPPCLSHGVVRCMVVVVIIIVVKFLRALGSQSGVSV